MQGGLGRIEHFDQRNLDYLITEHLPGTEGETGFSAHSIALLASRGGPAVITAETPESFHEYYWDSGWWGDQGDTPRCTEYAANHRLADGSLTNKPVLPEGTLYGEIQAIDRSEGRNFSEGATSLAMAKALKNRGYITEYLWGYSLADAIQALRLAPITLGIDWYTGMDNPSPEGIITATGSIRGGHEIEVNGINLKRGIVRLKNSWGRSWGLRGHALLPLKDLEALIADGGDVCVLREIKKAA